MTVGSPGEIQVSTTYPGYPSSSYAHFQLGHPVFFFNKCALTHVKLKLVVQIYIECAHFHYHLSAHATIVVYKKRKINIFIFILSLAYAAWQAGMTTQFLLGSSPMGCF
jgi:hypothetical protein